jgi:hypothetical protein
MKYSLFFRTDASILCLFLFISCVLMVMLGKFVRQKYLQADQQESRGGVNSLLGALFGLWGFILAFTFSNSSSRFDTVRNLMVDEANGIRNAILRADVFPDSTRAALREDLRKYLDARIAYFEQATNTERFMKAKEDAVTTGKALWATTVEASKQPNLGGAANNMFSTLTNMFDVALKRDAVLLSGVPELIMYMLFFLAMAISFIGGFTTPVIKQKEWIVITGFILLACIIIYITLDLGRPMRGLIRPSAGEDKIVALRKFFQ